MTRAAGSIPIGSGRERENSGASGRSARRLHLGRVGCGQDGFGDEVGGGDGGRGRTFVGTSRGIGSRISQCGAEDTDGPAGAQGDPSPRARCAIQAGAVAQVVRSGGAVSLAWDEGRPSRGRGQHRREQKRKECNGEASHPVIDAVVFSEGCRVDFEQKGIREPAWASSCGDGKRRGLEVFN